MVAYFSLNEQGCASLLRAICELLSHVFCLFPIELLVLILRISFSDKRYISSKFVISLLTLLMVFYAEKLKIFFL